MKTIPLREPFPHINRLPPGLTAILLCLLLFLVAAACKLSGSGSSSKEQETVLQFLSYIPNYPDNRTWVNYGDAAAWYASWNVPQVYHMDDVKDLDDTSRAYWMGMFLAQTYPPDCLDPSYIASYSLRDEFGFGLFDIDRFIFSGTPPKVASILEFSVDRKVIEAALSEKGYTSQEYGDGWVLFSLNEDNAINMEANTRSEKLGNLNRILLSEHFMIVGKATDVVKAGLDAHEEKVRSLAEDKAYIASVQALYDSSLKETGELVGVIWMDGTEFTSLPSNFGEGSDRRRDELMEEYGLTIDLPEFMLAAFATRHSREKGATYLILALVYPQGTDAEEASQVLAQRLEKAYSLRVLAPFLEIMRAEDVNTYAVKAGGYPATLSVFRLDDPVIKAPGEGVRPIGRVRTWLDFVVGRDLMFLYTGR